MTSHANNVANILTVGILLSHITRPQYSQSNVKETKWFLQWKSIWKFTLLENGIKSGGGVVLCNDLIKSISLVYFVMNYEPFFALVQYNIAMTS